MHDTEAAAQDADSIEPAAPIASQRLRMAFVRGLKFAAGAGLAAALLGRSVTSALWVVGTMLLFFTLPAVVMLIIDRYSAGLDGAMESTATDPGDDPPNLLASAVMVLGLLAQGALVRQLTNHTPDDHLDYVTAAGVIKFVVELALVCAGSFIALYRTGMAFGALRGRGSSYLPFVGYACVTLLPLVIYGTLLYRATIQAN